MKTKLSLTPHQPNDLNMLLCADRATRVNFLIVNGEVKVIESPYGRWMIEYLSITNGFVKPTGKIT